MFWVNQVRDSSMDNLTLLFFKANAFSLVGTLLEFNKFIKLLL